MSQLFEAILKKRGYEADFLESKYDNLADPFLLPDMKKAVERIKKAKKQREKILIYGDYDVDGVTASTIMVGVLELMGFTDVGVMLPDRFVDGYGMSERVVERAKENGVSLVISVDCGSNNSEVIDKLSAEKINVIVTDHHEITDKIPEKAVAVINAKRPDFREKMTEQMIGLAELSGAGVTFMLAKALSDVGEIARGQEKWLLDLAAIGTVCDSMNLTCENRIICHFGLMVLEKTRRPGLIELKKLLKAKKMTTDVIGFQIGPRLNAAGRMETAELSLQLLMSKSPAEAAQIAKELDRLNTERKNQQNTAIDEVKEQGVGKAPVIVVTGDWHEGILGIVAGRLTEWYKRPSFVLSLVDGAYKGSGRSFGDFNLAEALSECQDLLISGGGHAAAAGIKLKKENLEEFIQRINEYYLSLGLVNQEKYLGVKEDVEVEDFSLMSLDFMDDLAKLEPFGRGNEEPILKITGEVKETRKMGADGKHLRLVIKNMNGQEFKIVAFYAREKWLELMPGAPVEAWIVATTNEWNGTRTVEGRALKIEEIKEETYEEQYDDFPEYDEVWE